MSRVVTLKPSRAPRLAVPEGKPRLADVLLVEDNEGDARLTREALAESGLRGLLYVARDGEDALDFLKRRGRHAGAVRPDLVLLDLTLPRVEGREVLRQIKQDADLAPIPVVILTGSVSPKVVDECYALGANSFIQKPVALDAFVALMARFERYWLETSRLPPKGKP